MNTQKALPALLLVLCPQLALAQAPGEQPPAVGAPEQAPTVSPPQPAAAAATSSEPAVVEQETGHTAAGTVATPQGATPQGATPPAAEGSDIAPAPDRVQVGDEGYWQPGALVQAWFFLTHQDDLTTSTFRLRRSELSLKGELVPKLVAYKMMIDPAKLLKFGSESAPVLDAAGDEVGSVDVFTPPDDTSILQDVSVTFLTEYVDVGIGQFKTPLSYEGFNSSSKLLFPERALASRHYGDRRDIGLRFDKKFEYFGYAAGVYNGSGLNKVDQNNQKDIALRLEVYPVKPLTVAVVGYTSVGSRDDATTKDRVEGDLKLELGEALLQAEYLHGWDGPRGSRVEGHGYYAAAGYTFFDRLQPIVRIGMLDPDLGTDDNETSAYEFGANYYLRSNAVKLQASFSLFDPSLAGAPTRSELIVSTQLSF